MIKDLVQSDDDEDSRRSRINNLIKTVRKKIGQNKTDDEIAEELGTTVKRVVAIKAKIYQEAKFRHLNTDKHTIYEDYIMNSHEMICELHEIKKKFRNRGQWGALVAAVKQKREIVNDVIKLGQDFGLVDRKASSVEFEGEMSFQSMTEKEMREEIDAEVQKMHAISDGQVIEMREELIGVTDKEVASYVPGNLIALGKKQKKNKIVKISLKKRR